MGHTRLRFLAAAGVAGALVLVTTAPSFADSKQTTATTIVQMKVNEPSNLEYPLYHGAIWLEQDKEQQTYRWGGKACPGMEIGDGNLQMLYDAFRSRYVVILDYRVNVFKQKQYRCVTGFTVSRS